MLPHVVAEDGIEPLRQRRILVWRGDDLELAARKTSQPQPEPNCLAVVSLKVFLKASKSPKSDEICLAMSPVGLPPIPTNWPGP